MPRWSDSIDDDDDESAEGFRRPARNEDPDPSDQDDDIEDNTEPCPHCKTPIYEESEFCPHCGKYLSEEDQPIRKSTWIILGVVLAIIAAALWMR